MIEGISLQEKRPRSRLARRLGGAAVGFFVMQALFTESTAAQQEYPYPDDAKVVAMGDSFAAGTGAGEYYDGTDGENNLCKRSEASPGDLLAKQYNLENYLNISCRGASIADLTRPQYDQPPQLEALPPDADVVIVSLGGNITDLPGLLKYCSDHACKPDDERTVEALDYLRSDEFRRELVQAYQSILERSPEADVFVTKYPSPVEPRWWCPDIIDQYTDAFIESFVANLNNNIQQAVYEINSPRLVAVEPPADTDVCMTLGRGVATSGDETGHPTKQTNQKIKQKIIETMVSQVYR